MKTWLKKNGKYVMIGIVIAVVLFFGLSVGVPVLLKWIIDGPWNRFWPHQKTSAEVDASFVNAIIGFMTVGVTVFATYAINRQTIKETAKMNNETQKLMMKQLEIQEQQARSTLRDLVYQERVRFYSALLKQSTEHWATYILATIDPDDESNLEDLSREGRKLTDLISEYEHFGSQRMQRLLEDYANYINHKMISLNKDSVEEVSKIRAYHIAVREIIQAELCLDNLDNDIEQCISSAKIKQIDQMLKMLNVSPQKNPLESIKAIIDGEKHRNNSIEDTCPQIGDEK